MPKLKKLTPAQEAALEKASKARWAPPAVTLPSVTSSSEAMQLTTELNISGSQSPDILRTVSSTPSLSGLHVSSSEDSDMDNSTATDTKLSSAPETTSLKFDSYMNISMVEIDTSTTSDSETRQIQTSSSFPESSGSTLLSNIPILPHCKNDWESFGSAGVVATPRKRKIVDLETKLSSERSLKVDYMKKLEKANSKLQILTSNLSKEHTDNVDNSKAIRQNENEIATLKAKIAELSLDLDAVRDEFENYKRFNTDAETQHESKHLTDSSYMEIREDLFGDGSFLTLRQKGTVGQGSYYVKAPSVTVTHSTLTTERFKVLKCFLTAITCPDNKFQPQNVADCILRFLKREPEINEIVSSDHNLPKLSATDTLDVKICLGLSWKKFRMLKSYLIKRNLDVFNSEKKLWEVLRERQLKTEVHFEYVEIPEKDEMVKRPCVLIKDLLGFVTECCQRHIAKDDFEDIPGHTNRFRLVISGDKGGDTTKLTISFSNVKKSNSVRNLHIIGYYEGPDSAAALRAVFKRYASDFEKLKKLTLPFPKGDGTFEQRGVSVFLVGDTNFICHFMGHKGSSARYPCLFCLIPQKQLQTTGPEKIKVFDKKHPKRSFKVIDNDFSQSDFPLFNIDEDNICTPTIHIPLGIVTGIKNKVQEECHKMDYAKIFGCSAENLEDKKIEKVLEEKGKEVENAAKLVENIDRDCKFVSTIIDFIEQKIKRGKNLKDCEAVCEASICLMQMDYFKQSENKLFNVWFQCKKCCTSDDDAWYHAPCALLFFPNEVKEARTKAVYYCLKCAHGEDNPEKILDLTKQKLKEMIKIKQHFELQAIKLEQKFQVAVKDIQKKQGDAIKTFIGSLKQLGVDILSYFTGTIVGNHIKKILNPDLDGPVVFLECLESLPDLHQKLLNFLTLLNKIFSISNASQAELDDELIENLCIYCKELGEAHARDFPDENISPKLHMLIVHVPEFAKMHRTVGLFSEQPIESLHAVINSIIRLFKIRGDSRRMPLMYKFNVQLGSVQTRSDFDSKQRKSSKKLPT